MNKIKPDEWICPKCKYFHEDKCTKTNSLEMCLVKREVIDWIQMNDFIILEELSEGWALSTDRARGMSFFKTKEEVFRIAKEKTLEIYLELEGRKLSPEWIFNNLDVLIELEKGSAIKIKNKMR